MDHLLGYNSSPCQSPSPERIPVPSNNPQLPNADDVPLLARNRSNSTLRRAPRRPAGAGSDGDGSKGTSRIDGRRDSSERRETSEEGTRLNATTTKRQKLADTSRVPRIIIAGEGIGDNTDSESNSYEPIAFERSNPHWEGRWAGHLFLPLPPLHTLDQLEELIIHRQESGDRSADQEDCSDTSNGSYDSEEEDELPESRSFLPAARILIRYWANVLEDSFRTEALSLLRTERNSSDQKCNNRAKEATTIVILPHIPMKSDRAKRNSKPNSSEVSRSTPQSNNEPSPKFHLHISLARPIYLPAPSVDSFLSSISKCISTVLSASSDLRDPSTKTNGKLFRLRPRRAAIFANDERNRSFLTVPVECPNAAWARRVLLPPVDSTMKRFGLKSYYSEEGESCVLHVSVASVKGDLVKAMGAARGCCGSDADFERLKSVPLFDCTRSKVESVLESVPSSIPIRLDRVQCKFGQVKEMTVKF